MSEYAVKCNLTKLTTKSSTMYPGCLVVSGVSSYACSKVTSCPCL